VFSKRLDRIQSSATLAMTAKAAELRAQGINVLNFSVGEPDFNTPPNIINAAKNAMDQGFTKYTPGSGIKELKEAICTKLKRDNHLNYSTDNIIVSCGAKHALYNACQVLFQHGDEVIIFSPYWVSFPDFVAVTGAKPIFVKTISDNQYEPDFNDLLSKINSKTKGIIINSPSNPTGGVWSDEAIKQTLEIALKNNLWVFSDECYEQLVYDIDFKSIATFTSKQDKILTFQSCSKTYAMTGWRIGYTAGAPNIIKAMSKLQGQSTSCPNSIAQYAAVEALIGEQNIISEMVEIFKNRRDLIINGLNSINNIICDKPKGAFYAFPNISYFLNKTYNGEIIKSAHDLSILLLKEKFIVTVSGDSFGAPSNIRFSYATSEDIIHKMLERLAGVLSLIK
jgi:aspartate aminotransferase